MLATPGLCQRFVVLGSGSCTTNRACDRSSSDPLKMLSKAISVGRMKVPWEALLV
jgi:hypothetical protein